MNLAKLREPFLESEIEWRIAQCGKKGNGQIWARVLAYVQARAVMDRLDEVCGPANWRVDYEFIGDKGVICNLGILCPQKNARGETEENWVFKQDGSDESDIESFKGGISGALKRAAVAWGIGRYLYNLEEGWATIVSERGRLGKTKDGTEFYWIPPKLPAWALPRNEPCQANITCHPSQPAPGDGVQDINEMPYRITFGKFKGRGIDQVIRENGIEETADYVEYCIDLLNTPEKSSKLQNKQAIAEFITRAQAELKASESKIMTLLKS